MARVLLVGSRTEPMVNRLSTYEGIEVVFTEDVESAREAEGKFDMCIVDAMETGDCTSECPGLDFVSDQQRIRGFGQVVIVSSVANPEFLAIRFPWIRDCVFALCLYSDFVLEAVVCRFLRIAPQGAAAETDLQEETGGYGDGKSRFNFWYPPW